jgi:hypothetical protein
MHQQRIFVSEISETMIRLLTNVVCNKVVSKGPMLFSTWHANCYFKHSLPKNEVRRQEYRDHWSVS